MTRYRVAPWVDLDTAAPLYGLQGQTEPGAKFMHCCATMPDGTKRAAVYMTAAHVERLIAQLEVGLQPDMLDGLVPLDKLASFAKQP